MMGSNCLNLFVKYSPKTTTDSFSSSTELLLEKRSDHYRELGSELWPDGGLLTPAWLRCCCQDHGRPVWCCHEARFWRRSAAVVAAAHRARPKQQVPASNLSYREGSWHSLKQLRPWSRQVFVPTNHHAGWVRWLASPHPGRGGTN